MKLLEYFHVCSFFLYSVARMLEEISPKSQIVPFRAVSQKIHILVGCFRTRAGRENTFCKFLWSFFEYWKKHLLCAGTKPHALNGFFCEENKVKISGGHKSGFLTWVWACWMSHLLVLFPLEMPQWWRSALTDVFLKTDDGSLSQNLFYFHFQLWHRLYREREQTDIQLYATVF